ncbi:vWA domain-containing protein [Candidatus Soleaferrea massiliensis]|uniref:vWA domain-containing protein n=1 Tax=Candidatus Soleaferrea massiliensis TaxID=1470354 RepID=UPI00058C3BCE|nr:VWA domain-containing protein [Candidatus Soleaferrea massiliensis]
MKRFRTTLSLFLTAVFVYILACPALAADSNIITISADRQAQVIDTVIVMDNSGSMTTTDPVDPDTGESIGTQATKMFISSSPLNGSKMGIVSFSAILSDDTFRTSGLLGTDDTSVRKELSGIIDRIKEGGRSGGTNIPVGIAAAAEMLEQSQADSKAIILITDGENDPARDTEDPWKNDEILKSLNVDFPIYVIGLSQGVESGSVESFQSYLQKIAGSTERVFMLDDVSDIAKTIQEIDAMIYKTGDIIEVPVGEVSLDIPDAVGSCNISFVSVDGREISVQSVKNPSGDDKTEDQNTVSEIKNNGSTSTVNLQKPEKGVWNITVSGEEGDRVRVEWKISTGTQGGASGSQGGASEGASGASGSAEDSNHGGGFPWIWIVAAAVILLGGGAAVYFLMVRKPAAPLPGYMQVKLFQPDGTILTLQDWVELASFKKRVTLGTLSGFSELGGVLVCQGDDYSYEITFQGSAPAGVSGLEAGLNTDDTMTLLFEDTRKLEFTYKSFLC